MGASGCTILACATGDDPIHPSDRVVVDCGISDPNFRCHFEFTANCADTFDHQAGGSIDVSEGRCDAFFIPMPIHY